MFFDIRKIKHLKSTLDPNLIERLKTNAINSDKVPATVGKIINGVYTTDYDKWCTAEFVDYTNSKEEIDHLKKYLTETVKEHYNVNVLEFEIHFLHYKSGSSYKAHIDGQYIEDRYAKRGVDRDITAVVYLNDDYSGGEINFHLFETNIKPNTGDILLYPATWEFTHSVNKVEGHRYAIVFWLKTDPQINLDTLISSDITLRYLHSIIN